MRDNKIKLSSADRIFVSINTLFLIIIMLIVAYPLLIIISSSFSDPQAVIAGEVLLLPVRPTLNGYIAVFSQKAVLTGYANTLFYTVISTCISVILTMLAAYPLSRKDFFGKNIIMVFFTFTRLFGGGLIPSYLLNKSLGFVDSRWSMIILGTFSIYNVIITRTFLKSNIPDELYEAAELDGCNDFQFLGSVVIPLSKTIIAVLILFYAVGQWNSYYNALIYIRSKSKYPLQLVLRNILILSQIQNMDELAGIDLSMQARLQGLQDLLKYALIIVASLPILILYPFLQKYFVKGVMIGSLKG